MNTLQSPKLTRKGAQTRECLLDTAIRLFVEKGYASTTMRDVAAATGTSLGLTYHYFASKEDIVLALYTRLAVELEQDVQALAPAPIAERFEWAIRHKLQRLAPYRAVLGALLSTALMPQSGIAVLGKRTIDIQQQTRQVFLSLVAGANDAPPEPLARDLATMLYAGHLLILLFWLHDPTPYTRATHELITLTCTMLARGRRLLRLPPIAKTFAQFAHTIGAVFAPDEMTQVT